MLMEKAGHQSGAYSVLLFDKLIIIMKCYQIY